MHYFNRKELVGTRFETKRYELWICLSRELDSNGEIINNQKFKTKESLYSWISNKFNLSRSQIKRLINQFISNNTTDGCYQFVKHKNSFQTPHNKTSDEAVGTIVKEYEDYFISSKSINKSGSVVYIPFTILDLYFSKMNRTIKYDAFRKILIKNNIHGPFSHASTKKKIKTNLINEKQHHENFLKMINQAYEYRLKTHTKAIKKKRLFGEVVEIDGCIHDWIPSIGKCNIQCIVDSATGLMLSASLDSQETNESYIDVIIDMVKKFGLPKAIYGDKRRSIFSNGMINAKITKPLENLGVIVDCQSYPEHKPNIEGMWKVLQQALPNLLHRKQISSYEQLKEFVHNDLCNWYNKRYNKQANELNLFKPIDFEIFQANFCTSQVRIVQKGNYVKLDNKCWAPFNNKDQRIVMKEGGKVNVYVSLDSKQLNNYYIKRGTEKFFLRPIDKDVEAFSMTYLDDGSAIDQREEIIMDLKDKICNLNDELKTLKLKCIELGVNLE